MIEKEITHWRQVFGYEGLYEVNNLGQIKSLKTRKPRESNDFIMKTPKKTKGYLNVCLTDKDGKQKVHKVHRLVLIAFTENRTDMHVNHKDFDRTNNNINNLEWVTNKENVEHKVINGRHQVGEDSGMSKLKESDIRYIRNNFKKGCLINGFKPLGRKFNVNDMTIKAVITRKTWNHID